MVVFGRGYGRVCMKLCLLMVLLLFLHAQLKYGGLPEAFPRHGHEDNSPTGLPEAVPRHGHKDNSSTGLPEAVPRHGHEENSPTGLPEVVLEAGQQEVRPEGYVLELKEAGQQEVRPEGYVVALAFGEQLESGMHDLTQLSDLAHSWRLQVVEPYIQDSHFTLPTLPSRAAICSSSARCTTSEISTPTSDTALMPGTISWFLSNRLPTTQNMGFTSSCCSCRIATMSMQQY